MKNIKIERNPNFAVAYCRFSSDRQNDASIEAQQRAIQKYADENGITIIEWYIDKAQSAKNDHRINFQRMKKESDVLNYSKILVHKMDRFSRNILIFLEYEKAYQEKGIDLVYVAQPEMNNNYVKLIYASMAEQFLDNLSAGATKGMVINAEKGKRNGGAAPYGYKLVTQHDEFGNEMRSKPKYDTIRVTNEFPQIITKETFETAQKILKARIHRPPCNAEEEYLLTGKIICGECKAQYNGMRCKRHGKMYVYYKCVNQSSYKNGQIKKEYCHNNSVQKDLIENYVIEKLKAIVFNEIFIDQVFNEYNKFIQQQSTNNSMVEMLKNKIKDIDVSIANFLNVISSGFSSPIIIEKLQQLEKEKEETNIKLKEETRTLEFITVDKTDIAKVYRNARAILDSDDFKAKKRLVQNFVNKIVVYKDKVEVYINLIPTTCCATLDLDILKNHLFSGELKYGDWDLQGTETASNLFEYSKLCQKQNAKFKINQEFIAKSNGNNDETPVFTSDNQQGPPIKKANQVLVFFVTALPFANVVSNKKCTVEQFPHMVHARYLLVPSKLIAQ